MTKMERIRAVLAKKEVDRIPFSVYQHSTVNDRTVDRFVDYTLGFYRRYNPDYIKVMFDEHYNLPVTYDFIHSINLWGELEELEPHIGAFGRVLEALKRIKEAVGPDVPVIQTIYLPFHFGMRLAHRRILKDMAEDQATVLQGLSVITGNTVRFGRACLKEAGIDGFFLGAYGCETTWMSEDEYRRLIMPLDLMVVDALASSAGPAGKAVSILHIHGERDIFFNALKEYPVDALSWEDRTAGPPLREARLLTDKCLVGGIDFKRAMSCPPEEVVAQGREAVHDCGGSGLILAPGCTFLPATPENNMQALATAVGV
jgi:uroporphyrinogen decarboxylase